MMNDSSNFIKTIMKNELETGIVDHILTRFPPEPNAYLHIGHARAIIMNFELAKCFGGATNLRFDDTNPSKEDTEYVDAIEKDIEWLGYKVVRAIRIGVYLAFFRGVSSKKDDRNMVGQFITFDSFS